MILSINVSGWKTKYCINFLEDEDVIPNECFFACFGEFQVWGFRYYWLVGPLQISFVFVVVRLLDEEKSSCK